MAIMIKENNAGNQRWMHSVWVIKLPQGEDSKKG